MALKVSNKNRKKKETDARKVVAEMELQSIGQVFDNTKRVIDVDWDGFEEVVNKNPFASVPYETATETETEEELKDSIKVDVIKKSEFCKLQLITGLGIFIVLAFILL